MLVVYLILNIFRRQLLYRFINIIKKIRILFEKNIIQKNKFIKKYRQKILKLIEKITRKIWKSKIAIYKKRAYNNRHVLK